MPPRTVTQRLCARRGAAAASHFAPFQTPLLSHDTRGRNIAEIELGSKCRMIGLIWKSKIFSCRKERAGAKRITPALRTAPGDGAAPLCLLLRPQTIAEKKENSGFLGNIRVAGRITSRLQATRPGISPTASSRSKRQQRRVQMLLRVRDGWGIAVPAASGTPAGCLPSAERYLWK